MKVRYYRTDRAHRPSHYYMFRDGSKEGFFVERSRPDTRHASGGNDWDIVINGLNYKQIMPCRLRREFGHELLNFPESP